MPDDYLSGITTGLAQAEVVHFGFEEYADGCVYKVYLEFCTALKLTSNETTREPILLHLAYKWNPLQSGMRAVAKYLYHPGLSSQEIFERMSLVYSGEAGRPSLRIAQGIVAAASTRAAEAALMYIEVSEAGNPRSSFDLNLYEANLQVCEVQDFLFDALHHYAIPRERFEPLYEQISRCRLGHLSGGIDRHGRDFLTVYYEPAQG
jgi:hypothetical protein